MFSSTTVSQGELEQIILRNFKEFDAASISLLRVIAIFALYFSTVYFWANLTAST